MTWSKVHTSSILPNPGATLYEDQFYVEQLEEVFSWFAARGWTVTPKSDNDLSHTANWWQLEKQMTSYEGVLFSQKWNILQKRNGTLSQIAPISPFYALEDMDETQTMLFQYPSDFFPYHTATGIECWQSDEDSDSMLIVSTLNSGHRIPRSFLPSGQSIRVSGPYSSTTAAGTYQSILPLAHGKMIIRNTTFSEIQFGEVGHVNSATYATSRPVLTKGEMSLSNTSTLFARWRQSDVAMYENFTLPQASWDCEITNEFGTMLIDGDYYIRLGQLDCSTVGLLNCGSTNPGFNI